MRSEALFTSIVYNDKKIYSIRPRGEDASVEIRYVYDGDVVILGIGNMRPRVEKYLDCSIQKVDSLERNSQYLKIRTIISPVRGAPLLITYIDISKLNSIKSSVEEEDLDILALVDGIASILGTGRAAGISVTVDKGVKTKAIVLPTEENPSELEKIRKAVQPAVGAHRNYVPGNTLLYYAVNNMPDLIKAYPEVVNAWQAAPHQTFLAQFIEQIDISLNIDIQKDVLPFVGNELAFLFAGVDIKQYDFPMPLAAIIIKVKDGDKAAAFVDKIIEAVRDGMPEGPPAIEFKPQSHEGVKIYVLEIPNTLGPDAESIKPCYVLINDFLIVGSSVDQIKSMIDVSKGRKRGLTGTTVYRASGIPERNNSSLFIDWQGITNHATLSAEWLVKFAEGAGIGEQVRQTVEDHIGPIINVLSVIQHISSYKINTPQGEETISYIGLEDLPGF